MGNIRYQWASRVQDIIVASYQSRNSRLIGRRTCQSLSTSTPDVGVPFYLKGSQCLTFTTSACSECDIELCPMDSAVQFDGSRFVSIKNGNFCWEISNNCDAVSLQQWDCDRQTVLTDIFVVSGGDYRIELTGYGGAVGDYRLSLTCDNIVASSPPCDNSVIPISYGEALTGSTVGTCDQTQQFAFQATRGTITVSTCQSSFGTMLAIGTASGIIASGDDDGINAHIFFNYTGELYCN